MPRLVSLDVLRGLAIASVVFFHAMIFNSDGDSSKAAADAPLLMGFILYMVTWAGGFGMVSGMANGLSLYGRMREGKVSPNRMLGQAFLTTCVLLAINALYLGIFSPGYLTPGAESIGLLPAFIRTGRLVPSTVERMLFATALTMVAWGAFFTGLSLWLLGRGEGHRRRLRNYLTLGVLAHVFVWTYPLVQPLVRPWMAPPITWASFPGALVASWIAGPMDPIFPYAGFSLFGALLAMMRVDGVARWKVLAVGYGTGVVYSVIGYVGVRTWGFWNNPYDTPSLVPLLSIIGPMVLILTGALHAMDLSGEGARSWWARHTRGLRAFGLLSLTAFVLEGPVAAVLRRGVELVKPGFTYDSGFVFLIFAPGVTFLWWIVLKLWARWSFVGSLEWMVVALNARVAGRRSGRLQAGGILGENPRS